MDTYIIDTVAFLAYLIDQLPENADVIFKKAEKKSIKLLLPSIALGETLYTIYKGKEIFGKEISLEKIDLIFEILQFKESIELVDLNLDAWKIFNEIDIPELHDRMIVALYHYYKSIAVITTDKEIISSVPSVWN
ncbi:MAG: PIN domain-containing protein [Candidatus Lokiarchaeota archaeon]|nr:PIN domain-containing protein [Candidatus Lokiarchaeota archaeon]